MAQRERERERASQHKGCEELTRSSHDHKPDDPAEATRIYSAGLDVRVKPHGGVPRVGGSLAMSRALGDVKYK
eukprot:1154955-Pelagomonas_calceolata.AAC.7